MSGPLCLRGALRATARNTTTRALVQSTAQALLHASRRHASSASAASPSTTPPTPVDAPQSLTAEPVPVDAKQRQKLERIVRKQLEHMSSDPWHIAQYVHSALQGERFDEALLLTQTASSKDIDVVVSWNHLIDYQLARDNIRLAIKLFNEMKKREQRPNVQTFTIIFRGCARSKHPKAAVAEAMKHYNMLLADSRLQPNSTHLNAVLQVCARAGDLDSLFLAADSINEAARSPTAYTYTTIFNALRHHAMHAVKDLPEEQRQVNVQRAIDRAKRIWTEVVDRWRRGRLVIDEELVCAMGRLLLLARSKEESRGILDLLQQTMNIPNLSLSSSLETPKTETSLSYAVPGRNTLALVLTILASAKLTSSGIKYWNLLVHDHAIVPDADNWLRLFGMLKVARASAHAASVLPILPDAHLGPKPFRIAMETCVRDNINPKATRNADLVLDAMLKRLDVPDLQALRLYLRVALVSHYQMRLKASRGSEVATAIAKMQYGRQIVAALDRLWEPYKRTHYHYFKASASTPTNENNPESAENTTGSGLGETYNGKREVIALARLMFSAFNKVRDEGMLPEKEIRRLKPLNAKINREIQAFFANREQLEPKLNRRGTTNPATITANTANTATSSSSSSSRNNRKRPARSEIPSRHESVSPADLDLSFDSDLDPEAFGGEQDGKDEKGDSLRQGGDFVWDTSKPVVMVSREERRQRDSEKRSSSRSDGRSEDRKEDDASSSFDRAFSQRR